MIELRLHRPQTGFDVAEALAIRQLRKRHAEELVPAREARSLVLAAVPIDAGPERPRRDVRDQLRKDGSPNQHASLCWPATTCGDCPSHRRSPQISLRSHLADIFLSVNHLQRSRVAMTGHYCQRTRLQKRRSRRNLSGPERSGRPFRRRRPVAIDNTTSAAGRSRHAPPRCRQYHIVFLPDAACAIRLLLEPDADGLRGVLLSSLPWYLRNRINLLLQLWIHQLHLVLHGIYSRFLPRLLHLFLLKARD